MKDLIKSDFTKNVIKHFSGTAGANLITIISLPILTRIYSPIDFGLFQLMLSTVLTFSVISSLKLELAVVIPKYNVVSNTALNLPNRFINYNNDLYFTFLFTGRIDSFLLNAEKLSPYVLYISFGIFANGLFQLVQYVPIRKKEYSFLARTKIIQSGLSQSSSLTAGLWALVFLDFI
ncbi:MAG: hypothetical protein U5K00_07310 [Melioribacteraceae bacterium]|nr:hypothetical protein [Melioribacteraceae bacterium]